MQRANARILPERLRENMVPRIDVRTVVASYDREPGWTADETMAPLLTPLAKTSVMGTGEADLSGVIQDQA
jgi:hypothetical protein